MSKNVTTLVVGIIGGVQTIVDAVVVYAGATGKIDASTATTAVACIGIGTTAVIAICSKIQKVEK